MGHGLLPHKQLLTVRQLVIAVAIVAVLVFMIGYTGKVLKKDRVKEDYVRLQQSVQAERARHGELLEALVESGSEAEVESFARNKVNLIKPGDQPIIPLPVEGATISETAAVQITPIPTPENWQLWLDLLRN
jgi:cell division protein FtsB